MNTVLFRTVFLLVAFKSDVAYNMYMLKEKVMKRERYTVDMDNDQKTARLAHYNAWLLDPDRELGTLYPGFPEVVKTKVRVPKVVDTVKPAATTKVAKVAKKTRAPKGGTNRERVAQLVQGMPFSTKADKEQMVVKIIELLGVTRSNASVYAYNAIRSMKA
jgi:hypothetical protein